MIGRQPTAGPRRSISRRGFARGVVIPGLAGKCAYARSRDTAMPVHVTRAGHGAVMRAFLSACCEVPRVRMVLSGQHRSCQHRCGDQCSRQKFKLCHSISPSDMKSHKAWLLLEWRWRSNRPFKDNISSRRFNSARGRARGTISLFESHCAVGAADVGHRNAGDQGTTRVILPTVGRFERCGLDCTRAAHPKRCCAFSIAGKLLERRQPRLIALL